MNRRATVNWRIKRVVGFGLVLGVTFGPLGWLGSVAWRMAHHREAVAADSKAIAEMQTEIDAADEFAVLEGPVPAAPGGETAPRGNSLLDVELAREENVAEFLAEIELLAVRAELADLSIDLQPSATEGRTALQVVGRGSLEQLCHFLALVERDRQLSVVESMDLVGRDDATIDVTLGIARHHR